MCSLLVSHIKRKNKKLPLDLICCCQFVWFWWRVWLCILSPCLQGFPALFCSFLPPPPHPGQAVTVNGWINLIWKLSPSVYYSRAITNLEQLLWRRGQGGPAGEPGASLRQLWSAPQASELQALLISAGAPPLLCGRSRPPKVNF